MDITNFLHHKSFLFLYIYDEGFYYNTDIIYTERFNLVSQIAICDARRKLEEIVAKFMNDTEKNSGKISKVNYTRTLRQIDPLLADLYGTLSDYIHNNKHINIFYGDENIRSILYKLIKRYKLKLDEVNFGIETRGYKLGINPFFKSDMEITFKMIVDNISSIRFHTVVVRLSMESSKLS